MRVGQADWAHARHAPMVLDHVFEESFTGKVGFRAERAFVGTSIDDLLLLLFWNDLGLHRAGG